jgi:dephospho-CoA kinase
MKVIGVVGLPASGKGEFAGIAAASGIPVIVMGDMIRKAVAEAGLPPTDASMGAVANRLRAERGMDAIAQLCIPVIKKQTAPLVLIDGIRGDSEVRLFKQYFPDFCLIAIDTSFEKRLERLGNRGRSDDTTTADTLRARDERELGWGLAAALAMADYRLNNDGDLAEFSSSVRKVFRRLEGRE